MATRRRTREVLHLGLTAIALVVVLGGGWAVVTLVGLNAAPAPRAATREETATPAVPLPSPEVTQSVTVTAPASPTGTVVPTGSVVPTDPSISPSGRSVAAYRGLSAWVDIYDTGAWKNPVAAVDDMAAHGVKALFIETGNSGAAVAIKDPAAMQVFIREAHARDIKVIAWYLPTLERPLLDYQRCAEAIRFQTAEGQQFDSFALDIESPALKPVSARNSALATLSAQIREIAGPDYPLGAIIPSPVGLAKTGGYWRPFPYEKVAGVYDIFVPMAYYTYHGKGEAAAYADALANVRILRAQPGCAAMPINLIGGLTDKSTPAEVRGFVRAARETGILGAGLYDWAGTTPAQWIELRALTP
ncbi:MAG: hypothetical protein Q7W30_07915 [Coriobacteriia bacterium]|nr:hypothetical protein [Coriobacteriia bacterium]